MVDAFYSDPHFGHHNIIKFAGRPYNSLNEMHDDLIKRYNETIQPNETVVWCGDAFFTSVAVSNRILRKLNGRKLLVRGNHDGSTARCTRLDFDFVVDYLDMRLGGKHVHVSHYPYPKGKYAKYDDRRFPDRLPKRVKGRVLIHGHTHDYSRGTWNDIHVGVDAWDFRPARVEQLEDMILGGR